MTRVSRNVLLPVLAVPALLAQGPATPQILTCPPPSITASGVTNDPNEPFSYEHLHVTAGMPLQGNRRAVKFAPVLLPVLGNVASFQTAVVVDNPNGASPLTVDITLRLADGTVASTIPAVTIAPNGHFTMPVSPSVVTTPIGMVQVQVTPTSVVRDFVGATIYRADQGIDPLTLYTGNPVVAPLPRPMASMQPLQELQPAATRATFGPIPVRLGAGIDSLNGLVAFINLVNPSRVTSTLQVTLRSQSQPPLTSLYTLPPQGSATIYDPWFFAARNYVTNAADEDIVIEVVSAAGVPFLGEALLFDFFASAAIAEPGHPGHLGELFGRARMSSMMLAYTPTNVLVNPELTDRPVAPQFPALIDSTMGLTNVEVTEAGPVTVDYFGPTGALLGSDTIVSLPRWQSLLIGRGQPASPGFPTNVRRCSVEVRACGGGVIGWANRADETDPLGGLEMWGELLHGAGGREHASGWLVNGVRTKMAPLVLHDVAMQLPSYITFANHSVGNIGAHAFAFYDPNGAWTGSQRFAGIRFRADSFSYLEAMIVNPSPVGGPQLIHARDQHHGLIGQAAGVIAGIQTIGGELGVHLPFVFEFAGYPGPGDIRQPPWMNP